MPTYPLAALPVEIAELGIPSEQSLTGRRRGSVS